MTRRIPASSAAAIRLGVGLVAAATALSGCQFAGLNSVPLPLTKGGGSGDLRVTVLLENATNLVPNSEVKYDDVTVGSVRKIRFDDWRAKLTIGISADAHVPADVTARVAQKSLLGAEYLDLASPTDAAASKIAPLLQSGAVLGLDRTGRYPETEEVLSAAALLLNNGGLSQVRTITHELNAALDGRTGDVRSLVHQISTLTGSLDQQRGSIVGTLDQLRRLSHSVSARHSDVTRALDAIPQGVDELEHERTDLVHALTALDSLSASAHRMLSKSTDELATNLANLRPVTKQVADHADQLAQSIDMITFPFPIEAINKAFYGDYINFFADLNINAVDLAKYWTGGTALEALVAPLLGLPSSSATGATDPLTTPTDTTKQPPDTSTSQAITSLLNGLIGALGGTRTSAPTPSSGASKAPGTSSAGLGGLVGGLLGGGQ